MTDDLTTLLEPSSSPAAVRAGPQSVGRIFAILETLEASERGATLSELATSIDAPKTSLVGLLSGLTAEDCLVRDETGRYFLGPRFVALAMRTSAGRELVASAHPVLEVLVDASGETAVLGALTPDAEMAVYLDKVESQNPIRYAVTVGERRDLYCTAIGKVLLAYFGSARLTEYLKSSTREKFTPTTITGSRALQEELAQVRHDGLARTNSERINGASGLAAPIFSYDGEVIAAVLIAGPSERMSSNLEKNEQLVRQAAADCTRLVGGNEELNP